MVLDRKRAAVDPILTKMATLFSSVSPDVFTWLALFCAILAAFFFYVSSPQNELEYYFLLSASVFVFLNGLFDAVDGKIAKLNHLSSKKGDFLDHAIDRFADVFIVGGLALSPWCHLEIGFFAMIGMLLTSYMGTQAQAVGMKRLYAGLLGRADRLVLLMFAPVIQHILLQYSISVIYGYSLLDWVLMYLAIVGNFTAIQRFVSTLRSFKKNRKDV
jgi:archaetidylinositol phosphate synthase